MSTKTEILFIDTCNVRISDPGEEGAKSHFFEKINTTLVVHISDVGITYEFIRKIEDQVKTYRTFTQLEELFKFLGEYLNPVSLGLLGVKIGQLNIKPE